MNTFIADGGTEKVEPKKPWPSDAIMIVAAKAGEEIRANMESVVAATCRECGADLHADSASIRIAESLPSRKGRPIKFFCIACCTEHDRGSINELHDHRGVPPADRTTAPVYRTTVKGI